MKKIRDISRRFLSCIGLLTALFLSIAVQALSQDLKSEKDLQKQAENLFNDQDYIDAFPLFSQLLSLYPDNINYNYKFSVCMLFADKDKEKAIPYLEKVTSDLNADKKSYFYLGMAYHLNYEFDKAIKYYDKYKKYAVKKDADALQVDRRLEMCKNGLKLLRNKTDLSVLNKTEIKESEYFRAYDMDLLGGKILVKPDDFKSEADKEKNESSLVYLGKNAIVIFYSSLGKKGTNKDIYKVTKKSDGSWGSPEILPEIINSDYDEDFPVMHPNSNVLYFCSKGHNSMGGFDIFTGGVEDNRVDA